jgi:O-antigen ligase
MFLALLGLCVVCFRQTCYYPSPLLRLLHRQGFIALSVLLVISASFAVFPGEAFLQLVHFIPFFWLWAALVLYVRMAIAPWQQIYRWSLAFVLTAIPISLFGIVEYALKKSFSLDQLSRLPLLDWLYIGDIGLLRAFSIFDYPNTLASYLVMILGLNIGLVFLRQDGVAFGKLPHWLRAALVCNVLLTLACLYCSGSRNGYLVAAVLLLLSLFMLRTNRWMKLLGLASLALIVVTTLRFGLAGRSPSWAWVTDDPRVKVWDLALRMVRDQPIVGQGLGGYKLLYNGEVPGYDYIAHAHSLWLTLASEAGLPVTIGFTIVIGLICYRGWKGLRDLQRAPDHHTVLMGYYLCFLSITLFSLLDVTLFEPRVNVLSWLSLAVIYCSPELSRMVHVPSTRSASLPAGQNTGS